MKVRYFLVASAIVMMFSCNRERKVVERSTFPDGSPKAIIEYKVTGDRKEVEKETKYYPGNKLQVSGGYKEGKRDGYWVYYYKNGNKWSEGYFKNGKNDGKRTTYFSNGQIRYEAFYKEDKRVGQWRFFDEYGTLLKVVNYDAVKDTTKK